MNGSDKNADLATVESNLIARPSGPDPTEKVADLLADFLKTGGVRDLSYCEKWCEREGMNLSNDVLVLPQTTICKSRTGGKKGTKVVWLKAITWAENWVRYYDTVRGHHKHMVPRKEISGNRNK